MNKKACVIATLLTLTIVLYHYNTTTEDKIIPVSETVIEPVLESVVPETVNISTKSVTESFRPAPEPVLIDLGEFRLTAYCSCSKCCGKWASNRPDGKVYGASGRELVAGYSIATDPDLIPYGTVLIINGKKYESMDCGGAIDGKRIDIYFSNHEDAVNFGLQYAHVYREE